MKRKSVIIIGSGFGGLVAGNLLARKGHNVKIFESHNMPGGYTAGFRRSGFYFESGTLSFESSASVFKAMKDIGVLDKIEFARQNVGMIIKDFKGTHQVSPTKDFYYEFFPEHKEKLDVFFREIDRFSGMGDVMALPMPYLYNGLSSLFAVIPFILKGGKFMKLMKEYRDVTSSEFLERYFPKESKIYRLLYSSGYPDMNASYLAAGIGGGGMISDYWTVKTGMQSWADTLAESFKTCGGELLLNSYVDKIITRNGAAVGIVCKNTEYLADYIISASDYKKTMLKLLDNPGLLPQELRDSTGNAEVSAGFFTVYLGLNLSNEALRKYLPVPHSMYFDESEGSDIHDSGDDRFFEKTSIMIYSPSLINPIHAPEGKSSLMLQTMVPDRWMGNWGDGDKTKYKQLKERAMKAMIAKTSALIPGLEGFIEYQDAATPLTYERYTHNSSGATSAWSWNPKKKFYDQIMSVNTGTPVKNLFIGSCWAMQIGGIPGALAAAYVCSKRIR